MVTRIHKNVPPRLFLREHRKEKGLSAEQVAGRMGMERESLLRLEREAQTRCSPEKQAQYADAIGVALEDLWRPPARPSLDGMVKDAPEALQDTIQDVVKRMVGRG